MTIQFAEFLDKIRYVFACALKYCHCMIITVINNINYNYYMYGCTCTCSVYIHSCSYVPNSCSCWVFAGMYTVGEPMLSMTVITDDVNWLNFYSTIRSQKDENLIIYLHVHVRTCMWSTLLQASYNCSHCCVI